MRPKELANTCTPVVTRNENEIRGYSLLGEPSIRQVADASPSPSLLGEPFEQQTHQPKIVGYIVSNSYPESNPNTTHKCTDATETQHPSYTILSIIRGMIIGIIVDVSIDRFEDSTRNKSDNELREHNSQIVNTKNRATCNRLRFLFVAIDVILVERPSTYERSSLVADHGSDSRGGLGSTVRRSSAPLSCNFFRIAWSFTFLFLQELHDDRERDPTCDGPTNTNQTDCNDCLG